MSLHLLTRYGLTRAVGGGGVPQALTWRTASGTITEDGTLWTGSGSMWTKAATNQVRGDGSWYAEIIPNGGGGGWAIGIAPAGTAVNNAQGGNNNAGDGGRRQYFGHAQKRANGTYESYGASYTADDVIGIALVKAGTSNTIRAYKNGVDQGEMYAWTQAGDFEIHVCRYGSGGVAKLPSEVLYLPEGFTVWG